MKPRLKYADVFAIDFENMKNGTPLLLEGVRVTFEGGTDGHVWIRRKGRVLFIRRSDPRFPLLRLTDRLSL